MSSIAATSTLAAGPCTVESSGQTPAAARADAGRQWLPTEDFGRYAERVFSACALAGKRSAPAPALA